MSPNDFWWIAEAIERPEIVIGNMTASDVERLKRMLH